MHVMRLTFILLVTLSFCLIAAGQESAPEGTPTHATHHSGHHHRKHSGKHHHHRAAARTSHTQQQQ
jgi:Spy/CpxP family protein refolding chaperone